MNLFKKNLITLLLLVVCFVLIWPAIHNGYPLVYSDTGTYIASGFKNEIPIDRPIIYCLFVKYMSWSQSLWLVLISQLLVVAFVIYMLVRKFATKNALLITACTIVILSFSTSISNYTSQIMPDIFSALSIIGISILITTDKMRFKEYLLALVVVFSAMSHLSNSIVLLGIMLLTFFSLLFRLVDKKVFFRIFLMALIPIICTLTLNKIYSGKAQLSRASNVFIVARMIEIGGVTEFLKENCENNNYALCNRIDDIPDLAYQFIWNGESPLYDQECNAVKWSYCWEEKNEAFGELILDIIKISKYRNQILATCAQDFFQQNSDFGIGKLDPQREGTPAFSWIELKFNHELHSYENAKQFENTLEFKTMSSIQAFVIVISLIVITLLLFFYKKMKLKKNHILLITTLFAGILSNALTVVSFSTVLDRYQSRIIWIIPLIAIVLIYRYIILAKKRSYE